MRIGLVTNDHQFDASGYFQYKCAAFEMRLAYSRDIREFTSFGYQLLDASGSQPVPEPFRFMGRFNE